MKELTFTFYCCALLSCADLTGFLILRGFVGALLSCAVLLLRAAVRALLSARFCLARFCYGAEP